MMKLKNIGIILLASFCVPSSVLADEGAASEQGDWIPDSRVSMRGKITDEMREALMPKIGVDHSPVLLRPPYPDPEQYGDEHLIRKNLLKHDPVPPDFIPKIKEYAYKKKKAMDTPVHPMPRYTNKMFSLRLDISSVPPVVNVSPGCVTTVSIIDLAGKAWPLLSAPVLGDKDAFSIEHEQFDEKGKTGEEGLSVFRVIPKKLAGQTVLSLSIKKKATPISVILNISDNECVLRADMQIPDYYDGSSPAGIGLAALPGVPADSVIMAFLSGTPPAGAIEVGISGGTEYDRAWLYNGYIYLRTLNGVGGVPEPVRVVAAAGGIRVAQYAITPYISYENIRTGEMGMMKLDIDYLAAGAGK